MMESYMQTTEKSSEEKELEFLRASDEVSRDIFNEIYRVVQKLESRLGRAKKVDTIELRRRARAGSDSIDIAEITICYTDYSHRLMPRHAASKYGYPCGDGDYITNQWVITCPDELQFFAFLDKTSRKE
jgi:hypothetical protein